MTEDTAHVEATAVLHFEDDSWWAELEGQPGYLAVATTLPELRELLREGVPFFLDTDPGAVQITERFDLRALPSYRRERLATSGYYTLTVADSTTVAADWGGHGLRTQQTTGAPVPSPA